MFPAKHESEGMRFRIIPWLQRSCADDAVYFSLLSTMRPTTFPARSSSIHFCTSEEVSGTGGGGGGGEGAVLALPHESNRVANNKRDRTPKTIRAAD